MLFRSPFAFVGGVGLIVHMFALRLAFYSFGNKFAVAQAIATLAAMTSNFFLNNATTYRDKRLRGHQILPGLLRFYLVGSAGAVANIGLASWIYAQEPVWWLSGAAGALMGALWNYTMSSRWVWQAR